MNETANEMNEWENIHIRHKMTERRRQKSKSDMIEWEIDETYRECGIERRMSEQGNKRIFHIQKWK